MPDHLIRPARATDIEAFLELARLSGAGFTSLPEDADRLAANLAASEKSFLGLREDDAELAPSGVAGFDPLTNQPAHFILMLENGAGEVVGCAAIKAQVGVVKPFFNFKIFQVSQASFAAKRRFDMEMMLLINEFAGCSEIGTFFVRPEARGGGIGRMLGQARYLLMAAAPERFGATIVAELRGIVDEAGRSPFWDHLGAKFFKMGFSEADHLSAVSDSQFIIDLMPKYPIYLDLLPEEARRVIGQVHREGGGAMKLLRAEGFRYDRVIDIFDGGPLVSVPRSDIRTIRESRVAPAGLLSEAEAASTPLMTLSSDQFEHFRVLRAPVVLKDDAILAPADALARLGARPGDLLRASPPAGAVAAGLTQASAVEPSSAAT